MSIQVGTTNLTNYRTYSDQLYLTTTSNSPLIQLDTNHVSQNVFIRSGNYFMGQSNANFYIGLSNTRPILQYHLPSCNIVVSSNILASNVQATFRRISAIQQMDTSLLIGSNLSITYDSANGTTPIAAFKSSNAASNLFVVNGYDSISYFTGRLGIGTTLPSSSVYLDTPSATIRTLGIDTLSFTTSTGIYMSNVFGSIHCTKPTVFEGNVDVVGGLSAGSFDIADLSTNRGVFRSNVVIQDYVLVNHSSNNAPSLTLRRNFLSSNAAMFSNVSELQPIFTTEFTTRSNTTTITTKVLTIDPTGKIGIGTTVPRKTIDIYPSSYFANTVSNTGLIGIQGVVAEDFITVTSNAFVGIGTAKPVCYLDMMIPSCNVFASNSAPGYLYIHSNSSPRFFMDSNGHIGINTTTTRSNAIVYIDGVLECEYLSPHRFTTPGDTPNIDFSLCNIGNIYNVNASNVNTTTVYASNIYCDLITASNYDLLAFNSYVATKEMEMELDDLIFTGKNTFIMAKNYPLYFDVIGASNPQGGLDGTTDSNLERKPTDHYILASFGKMHIVSENSCNLVTLHDGRAYNNAIVATSCNQFYGVDCNVAVFIHTQGSNGAGYSFGLTQSNVTINDSICRISLDPYPYNDTATPITTYGYDTFTFAMEPYGSGARRIGCRYNYTQNTLHIPKMYVVGDTIPGTIDSSILNSMSGYTVYTRGNVKAEATSGAATLYNARYTGASGNELTFSIGSNIAGPTGYYLDVNGKGIVRNDFQVIGKIYANSVISQTSDRRLKDHLTVIEEPLAKIKQLTGYTFDRTDLTIPIREAGLIAQDVQQVLPEVVHQNNEGYYSIAYGNLASLFVESIKALEERVRQLEDILRDSGTT